MNSWIDYIIGIRYMRMYKKIIWLFEALNMMIGKFITNIIYLW